MKKQIIMILSAITVCAVFLGCAKATTSSEKNNHSNTETAAAQQQTQSEQHPAEQTPIVYMTKDISSVGLINIYNQLNFSPQGNVAIKLSTGEAGNTHYLDPNLIKDLVQSVNGTIVECNTAYGGSRASTAMHKQVAKDHGFTDIANVDILDENGTMELSVYENASHLKYDIRSEEHTSELQSH